MRSEHQINICRRGLKYVCNILFFVPAFCMYFAACKLFATCQPALYIPDGIINATTGNSQPATIKAY